MVLEALLDDREVEVADQLAGLPAVVLQRHRHAAVVDLIGDPAVEAQLVGPGDVEAGLVFGFPAGEVVGLDRVEALAGAHVEAMLRAASRSSW